MQGPPTRRLVVEFTKMTGAGNDFIVIDNRFYRFRAEELGELARRFCARRTGVGADGLMALDPADPDDVHFRMRYHNSDGSLGTMCGNGARCLARYARLAGMEHEPLLFETDAGPYRASVPADLDAPVRLFLPHARSHRELAARFHDDLPDGGHFVWTGTEHLVVFVPRTDDAPVDSAGPRLRAADSISETGVNVDFVEVLGSDAIRVRTWEKGVEGETLACGTGATAAAVVSCLTGRTSGGHVRVHMAGGELGVGIEGDPLRPDTFYLEGPADIVYRGTLEV